MNGNERLDAGDGNPLVFGGANTIPVYGDWDGSGKTELGTYENGVWRLVTNSGVEQFTFGFPGPNVIPVVGDWNADGKTEVGVYNQGDWFLDVDGSHTWDATNQAALAYLGWPTTGTLQSVVPVPGYWAGDGRTELGVYSNGAWFLDTTGTGKWDGAASYWGWSVTDSSVVPVVGNWTGNGSKDQLGVYRDGVWFRDVDGTHQWDPTNQAAVAYLGWQGATPVVGNWVGATQTLESLGNSSAALPAASFEQVSPGGGATNAAVDTAQQSLTSVAALPSGESDQEPQEPASGAASVPVAAGQVEVAAPECTASVELAATFRATQLRPAAVNEVHLLGDGLGPGFFES